MTSNCVLNGTPVKDVNKCRALEKLSSNVASVGVKKVQPDSYELSDKNARSIFDQGAKTDAGRTTWTDFYALNRSLGQSSVLTGKEFWSLAQHLDRPIRQEKCLEKRPHKFYPFSQIHKPCSSYKTFLKDVAKESEVHPVLVFFQNKNCTFCRKFEPQLNELAFAHPEISIYKIDVTEKTPETLELLKQAKVDFYPFSILFENGQELFRGNSFDVERSLEFQSLVENRQLLLQRKTKEAASYLLGDDFLSHLEGSGPIGELLDVKKYHALKGVLNSIIIDKVKHLKKIKDASNKSQKNLYYEIENYIRSYKSAIAFDDIAGVAENETPVKQKRSLNVLVPASGYHVAPLIIATTLIDRDIIDRASFVYTEIAKSTVENLMRILIDWSSRKTQMSRPKIESKRKGKYGGNITTIKFFWLGKPITIDVKINDSPGNRYFTKTDARNADVIVYHDLGYYSSTPVDIVKLPDAIESSLDKKGLENNKQKILVINEFGNYSGFISPFFAEPLNGSYGHSHSIQVYNNQHDLKVEWGEISEPPMKGTWLSLDPTKQMLIGALKSRKELEHLIDLGILAYELPSEGGRDKSVRLHITKKKFSLYHLRKLWNFGLKLVRRVKANPNAAKCLNYLLIHLLALAQDRRDKIGKWADRVINSFANTNTLPGEFFTALSELGLAGDDWVVTPEGFWDEGEDVIDNIDQYLILE